MAVILTDNFNRTSTTSPGTAQTGQAWRADTGTWGTDGTWLYCVSATDGQLASVDVATSSHDLTVKLQLSNANAYPSLLAGLVDASNHYRLEVSPNGASTLFRVVGGAATKLADYPVGQFTDGGQARLSVDNTSSSTTVVKSYSSTGALLGTMNDTDASRPKGTRVGARNGFAGSGTCRFDDVSVSNFAASGDTTAPTVPGSVTATANSATQVTVSWSPSTDAVGVSSYRVRRGGADLTGATALTGTSFVDTSVAASTAYSYTVSAVDAAGNRSAESTAATVTTPAAASTTALQTRVGGSWVDRVNRVRSGGAWVSVLFRVLASAGQVIDPGTGAISTPARWQVPFGSAPLNRATWETGVNSAGQAQVTWAGSMPDTRARSSRLETGVLAQAQDGYQAQIIDTTNSIVVADSGAVTSATEKWVATSFTPVAGRAYRGQARVRAADGQWSAYAATRFVAPTGVVRFFETFGAVGDGTTNDNSAIRTAVDSCNPGDVLRSNSPGTVLAGVSASSTALTAATALFTSGMVGKTVLVRGAGTTDSTSNSWSHRTTISAVASDGKSATLAAAVLTAITGTTVIVGARVFLAGHTDVDGGLNNGGTNAKRGGQTIDGTGCIFVSDTVNSAGFRTTLPDVTYRNVHFWQRTATTRGNGLNGNTGPFFIEGAAAIGLRLIGCIAERARDAGFLIYNASSDIHVVDCVADHTNADGFHVTGSGHDIQFIRTRNYYIGDDAVANIGYRSDGDSQRPYNIIWENPEVYGQDWGRGVSFGGCYNCLVTDGYIERGAGASFILGSDGDMANTANIQIRRFRIVAPNLRRGQKPTYSQGSGTSSTIPDEPVIKLLNSSSPTAQRDILLEDCTFADARYMQIISYGGATFVDNTITMRGVAFTGTTNAGTNWRDEGTYPGHLDLRGITVPSGSTAITAAPANPNS